MSHLLSSEICGGELLHPYLDVAAQKHKSEKYELVDALIEMIVQ